ncbi:MAG TPA: nuclear transport factor 2 family protein [Gammaproteobacteria bacterium]
MNDDDLERWLARYGEAWETRDADAAARLFARDALYFETPFADPFRGPEGVRSYWSSVTKDQREIRFESKVVGVLGRTGVARWSAKFKLASTGAAAELNGIFLLEFDDAGRCTSLREWWHAR